VNFRVSAMLLPLERGIPVDVSGQVLPSWLEHRTAAAGLELQGNHGILARANAAPWELALRKAKSVGKLPPVPAITPARSGQPALSRKSRIPLRRTSSTSRKREPRLALCLVDSK
jgi:hypothetical protein